MLMSDYQIAIGLPSYNEAERISYVVEQVDKGLKKYFPDKQAIIVNIDSNSPDHTQEVFLGVNTHTIKKVIQVPRGKGSALIEFWKYASQNQIPYIATIDTDLHSITPEWISSLLTPLINKQADVILPLYGRNRFKANITNQFAYPLMYSIFGVTARQPLAGEFGYSQSFYEYLLNQEMHPVTKQYGIDIFITSYALAGGFQIVNPDLKEKGDKPSFYHQEKTWLEVSQSGLLSIQDIVHKNVIQQIKSPIGPDNYSGVNDDLSFSHKQEISKLLPKLQEQFNENQQLNQKYLNADLLNKVSNLIDKNITELDSGLWTDILQYTIKPILNTQYSEKQIFEISTLLLPIYRWRVVSYWLSVENISAQAAEQHLTDQAKLLKQKLNYHV